MPSEHQTWDLQDEIGLLINGDGKFGLKNLMLC